ncbi:hypothetical protein [Altererythrobacter litoralis]|uniref:DUF2846 domain-containing protein n=1 Tax=Altererythrobacter litoralis TaxID=3113904 RepID=A0ABU7GFL9_9SPHN|nr:hypothetical protein [Erythrobacteraceae bacterium 1XM1-14]
MVSRFLGALMVSGLIPSLSACWSSDEPLIFQAGSVQPVEAGAYRFHAHGEDPVDVELQVIPGGGYVYHSDDEVMSLFVHEAAKGWYAVQFAGEGSSLLFAVAHVSERRVDFYDPPCDEELGAIEGIEQDGNDCLITSSDGLMDATRIIAGRIDRGAEVELNSWAEPAWPQYKPD